MIMFISLKPGPLQGRRGSVINFSNRSNRSLASMAAKKKTLISFDVDGTLVRSVGNDANKLHKEAFSAAFKEVFDLNTTIDVIPHHGSTDGLILIKVCVFHGIPHQEAMNKLPEMQQVMIDYFMENVERAAVGIEVLPGVLQILKTLQSRDDVVTCLVTGNLEPIGWAKMKALNLKQYFTEPVFGGFGSNYCSGNTEESWKDRAELIRIAAKRCIQSLDIDDLGDRYHVGDAPMDMQAAAAAETIPVGVLTGIYTREELESVCQSAILLNDGLKNFEEVMSVFKL